jgi:hypothetical protein
MENDVRKRMRSDTWDSQRFMRVFVAGIAVASVLLLLAPFLANGVIDAFGQ